MKFNSASEKRRYVNDMFGRIAYRYDVVNRLMSGGFDILWRRRLIQEARLVPGSRLLDVATGTGDVVFTAMRYQPELGLAVGGDFTLPMLDVGNRRSGDYHNSVKGRIHWTAVDTLSIPFSDGAFDIVTSAFLMRNVVVVSTALKEQMRVVRPGGRVLVMDVPRPPKTLWGDLFRFYFHQIMPRMCGLVSGQPDAYVYLPQSADVFLNPDQLASVMQSIGLKQVQFQLLMKGTVALHTGTK